MREFVKIGPNVWRVTLLIFIREAIVRMKPSCDNEVLSYYFLDSGL